MIKVCKNCRYWCASALEHNMIGYCEGGNNKYMPEHIRVKHRTHEACSMFKPIQEAQDIIDEAYQHGRAEAIEECINVVKYNGQQPLDVLVRRLELLKEKGNE